MTREEQIAIASCAYGSRGSSIDFTVGAKWADSHPKPAWISVDEDLPCNHEELVSKGSSSTKRVIVIEDGGYYFDRMVLSENGKWKWFYSFNPSHWFPIPEPPKE